MNGPPHCAEVLPHQHRQAHNHPLVKKTRQLWDSTTKTGEWGRSSPPCRSIASLKQTSSPPHAGNKQGSCETLLPQPVGGDGPPHCAEVLPHQHRWAHSHPQVKNKAAMRLYYYSWWVGTVQPAMQKDCLIDTDKFTDKFTSNCR